jgi:hypothetical protein
MKSEDSIQEIISVPVLPFLALLLMIPRTPPLIWLAHSLEIVGCLTSNSDSRGPDRRESVTAVRSVFYSILATPFPGAGKRANTAGS